MLIIHPLSLLVEIKILSLFLGNEDLRPCPVRKVAQAKPKDDDEPPQTTEITEKPTIVSDTSFGDIAETDEPVDEGFVELGMLHDLFGDTSSENSEPKVSEICEPPIQEIIVSKPKSKTRGMKAQSSTGHSAVAPSVLTTSEISTAEDCRLEISLEMKAEQELRRLSFTSRQRFLTGMDLKSGVELRGIAVAGFGCQGVGNSEGESSGSGTSEGQSSRVVKSEGEGSGIEKSEDQNSEVEEGRNSKDAPNSVGEENDIIKTYHFISECIGSLIVDCFKGRYEAESVMELCLLLCDSSNPPFLVTRQAMESSLEALSTVEGKSARFWNLTISWLRMLLRQTQYVNENTPDYVTASNLVDNTRFSRVLGRMLTTCDMGDSGQNVLGPSLVKNFKLLLKELLAITSLEEHHGIKTSQFQELLIDTLLYMTTHR